MTQETVKEIISLVFGAYKSFMVFKKSGNMNDFNKASKALELADATIYASTKPKYFPTGEGWDLLLVNSPSKDDIKPPTEEAIMEWFRIRSLA